MHVAVVTPSLPQPSSNGGPMTCWAILKTLVERNHRVTVFSLVEPSDRFNTQERQAVLASLGVQVIQIPVARYLSQHAKGSRLSRICQYLRPSLAAFHPAVALVPHMKTLLEQARVDAMFVYHYPAIAATHGLRVAPRMAGTGDLWHWPNLQRWRQAAPQPTRSYISWTFYTLAGLRIHPHLMAELLNDCDVKGCFGAEDAAWLRRHGVPDCSYFRSPILDACGAEWQALRDAAPIRSKPKILTAVSNLGATSTSAMLRLFATKVLPHLERELGPEGFEVHVVGEGEPPKELARLLPRPSVILRGRVEPADPEFLSADVLLVSTPIKIGIRLRIVSGMSFGCCIVAHTAEVASIPELIHGRNALLAATGCGLAEQIIRAIRDPALRRRLGASARMTYEEHFHPRVAASRIVAELERLVESHRNARSFVRVA